MSCCASSKRRIAQALPRLWYQKRFALCLLPLLPISWLFRALVCARRILYRYGVLSSYALPVPVVVVGNLSVGGNGKTPLVLHLLEQLSARAWRVGVVSRGHGRDDLSLKLVSVSDQAASVGDEPLLIARRSGVPVVVGRDRVAAAQFLLAAHPECNLIIADDGLQHYRLRRDFEIAVFDGRATGNGHMLPAGPLREPVSRASSLDALVWNGEASADSVQWDVPQFSMCLLAERFYALNEPTRFCSAADLCGKRLYALAGIGNPQRFFNQLERMGLTFEAHAFPDHHCYSADDFGFAQGGVLLMTEKDAVKCTALSLSIDAAWVLPVSAEISPELSADMSNDTQSLKVLERRSLLELILEKIDGRPLA